jgi:hypothetical protein
MFRASICPSSGVHNLCIAAYGVQHYVLWLRWLRLAAHRLSGPQPQHLVLNTTCSNTQFIYSWRWAYRCPKYVELFKIINQFVHQVGNSRHFYYNLFYRPALYGYNDRLLPLLRQQLLIPNRINKFTDPTAEYSTSFFNQFCWDLINNWRFRVFLNFKQPSQTQRHWAQH